MTQLKGKGSNILVCRRCGGTLRYAGFISDTILFYCPKCEESYFGFAFLPAKAVKLLGQKRGAKLYYTLLLDEYIKRNCKPVPANLVNWQYRMATRVKGSTIPKIQQQLTKLGLVEIVYIKGYKYLKPKII